MPKAESVAGFDAIAGTTEKTLYWQIGQCSIDKMIGFNSPMDWVNSQKVDGTCNHGKFGALDVHLDEGWHTILGARIGQGHCFDCAGITAARVKKIVANA